MGAAVALHRVETFDAFEEAREQFDRLPEFLLSQEALGMKHSDMERELEKRGLELMRTLYQTWLDERSAAEAEGPVRDEKGKERPRKRTQ
ncbi:MAG: hypothetical protein ACC742_16845, partial [Thermoanaerobaculales bacterium]